MPSKVTPAYRKREDRAVVTLTDRHTKERHDYPLGPYDDPTSRQRYHQLLAEWEANDYRLPPPLKTYPRGAAGQMTLDEISLAYWKHCQGYYFSDEVHCIKGMIKIVRQFFGTSVASDFGPKSLRLVRDQIVRGDSKAEPPRLPWSRKYVNHQVQRLCRMFKWAASQEMLPASVYQQLLTVEPLRRGRCEARENPPVKPVSMDKVDGTRPFLSRQVEALIDLQLLTGARGGELFKIRRSDIQMDVESGLWTYRPMEHKTAFRDKVRTIIFGPRAQSILMQFMEGMAADAYLFSPAQAMAEQRARRTAARKTPQCCGNTVGSNRRKEPRKKPADHYTRESYLRAIYRACDHAFEPPAHLRPAVKDNGRRESMEDFMRRLTSAERSELKAWRKAHRWHPHQLRHVAGTELRRRFGLEAAQLVLGHSSAQVTDAVYAERDLQKIGKVMKQVG